MKGSDFKVDARFGISSMGTPTKPCLHISRHIRILASICSLSMGIIRRTALLRTSRTCCRD